MFRIVATVLFLSALLTASPAAAQSPLDKTIGPDEWGEITATAIEPALIGKLARAAGVPMGIEAAPGAARKTRAQKLTGLTLRAALEAMAAIDPRYEWREMNGVIVLRTPDAWNSSTDPLELPIQALLLSNVRARNALSVIAAFLGAPQSRDVQFDDAKRFSLQLDSGTVLDLLNATVRAHGELAWSFEPAPNDRNFPFLVSVIGGATGFGCGVPGRTPQSPVNLARYLDPAALAPGGSMSVVDRVVGIGPNELPLVVNGPSPWAVDHLADATRVPMGLEFLGPGKPPPSMGISATGRRLRDVLDAMVAVDPRYEWREMDGVVVIRPAAAWNDAANLLFRMVAPIRMIDVPAQQAIQRLAREVGYQHPLGDAFGGNRVTLDLPQGTVLDLANAIVRTHGELTWTLDAEPPLDGARAGYRYTFMFSVMGGGGSGFGAR
jgi:hypothetical protein